MEQFDIETDTGKTIQNETINGLIILFYKNFINYNPKRYTNAYGLCRALVKRMDEKEALRKLEGIYEKTTIGYPLGLLETIVYRDVSTGSKISKGYNYGYRAKPVVLGDMIQALDICLSDIMDIFTEICIKHNFDPNIITADMVGITIPQREGAL